MTTFKLPDLGEGLPEADIVEWHVKVGDEVTVDQPLVSMETAKAVVEVPSPIAGKIVALHGSVGDTIETGGPLVQFEQQASSQEIKSHTSSNSTSKANDTGTVAGKIEVGTEVMPAMQQQTVRQSRQPVKATPAVRALAKKLQVNLAHVSATGPNGVITVRDVEMTASHSLDLNEYVPLKGVRKMMAQAMQQSHAEVVPVTIMEDALLPNFSQGFDITVNVIRAIAHASSKEPALNAWFNTEVMGRKLLDTINLGLAVDTEDGLFVPVMKDIGNKTAEALRAEITQVRQAVVERSIPQDQLKGASIVLSNFGKFAGRYANPVVVPPTVAILGVGKMREEMVVQAQQQQICTVLPLALTFDHRACTGGEATRFLGEVLEFLLKAK